jgi:uncharacterized protein YbjQ (UPF0145 family)
MPLFHRETADEKQQKEATRAATDLEIQLQEKSKASLLAGGLPLRAQERVGQIREAITSGAGVPLFSSDLSVNEFLLARQLGYEPVGLVAGSCVYHIGWTGWTYTGVLDNQTEALFTAATSAIDRMRQEAQGMGALGVVGVRLEIRKPAWGESLIEVVAMGTAIHAGGAMAHAEPFMGGLSAQEYCTMLQAGVRPVGFVFGNCAYYIYTSYVDQAQNFSWYNQEVVKYSQSVYDAQRHAFGRMHRQAEVLRAHGVIGVHFDHTLRRIQAGGSDSEREDYIVEYIAWGTAIVEAPTHAKLAAPQIVVDLEDVANVAGLAPGTGREGGLTQ